VKAAELSYECPSSLEEALELKKHWKLSAQFLAGGQSLIPAINMRLNSSECLIDLNRIASLRGIREEDGCVVIGAMTRHAEVAASPIVRRRLPALVEASRFLAHSAIRNRGTFGGSIALFDPAAEWPAACSLLDARIHTVSPAGRRTIAAERFIQGLYKTDLDENGLIESVSIPFQEPVERSVVLEQSRRLGDFASAAVMARGVLNDTSAPALRLVFFAVSDRPLRIESLEEQLIPLAREGLLPEIESVVKEALTSRALVADLYHSVPTKRHLAAVLARRAIAMLLTPQS
jgi:carbon-monoxide dehydrogenase medium subunit